MKYVHAPPPPFQLDTPRGRGNTYKVAVGGAVTPGQSIPGSVTLSLKIKGYPRWRSVEPAMRAALLTPLDDPRSTRKLAHALSARFYPAYREFFLVFALDRRLRIIAWYVAAIGTGSTVQIGIPDVFRNLLVLPSHAFIVVHNHPSGDARPSGEDILLTERLGEAANLLGLQLLDHLIVGADGHYTSLAELGYVPGPYSS